MDCFVCKSKNADDAKFCNNCGVRLDLQSGPLNEVIEASVRREVDLALTKYTADQKIAEFDITETVTNRLLGWAKLLGSAFGVLIIAAGVVGIKEYFDINGAKKEVQKETDQVKKDLANDAQRAKELASDAQKAKEQTDQVKKDIASEAQRVNNLVSEDQKIAARYSDLEQNITKYEKIGQDFERLQKIVQQQEKTLGNVQEQVVHLQNEIQPLPKPSGPPPFHLKLENIITSEAKAEIEKAGKLAFHVAANIGSPANPSPEMLVADRMVEDFGKTRSDKPSFLYLLGNLVFYNGEAEGYYAQFYKPYEHYPAPIFAIPGNHDGSPATPSVPSLDAFVHNFCTYGQPPHQTAEAGDIVRAAMVQPNCYWTLETPLATIIGLYTNVPSDGVIDATQLAWLQTELRGASEGRALVICLHHSICSFDNNPSGSTRIADALESAINASRRVPNIILSAAVFNYQRMEWKSGDITVPCVNVGNGGYQHLRKVGAKIGTVAPGTGVQLICANDHQHGYLTLVFDKDTLSGTATFIGENGGASSTGDKFSYTAKALHLKQGEKITL